MKSKLLVILILFIIGFIRSDEPVTIHVVPHTHDDAGWLWTFQDYFEGNEGAPSVKNILDNFIVSLNDNPERTFIYVEMAFFTKWYKTQSDSTKQQVKQLLKEGRFEFINGGYVMHDEAASYYQHFIDQMRLGLQFLKEEFDFTPEIAWFIDPFGHSAANAYVLSKMGFTKIAFVRIDYKDKNIRRAKKSLEFYWFPYDQINENAKIFTHVTYDHYCLPPGMDGFINDQELHMTASEVQNRSQRIYSDLKTWNSGFMHKNVLLMYGCDFTFKQRDANYKNVEQIMDYVNKNYSDMKMVYSTPSKYFKTIFEQVKEWPEYRNADFFPYADDAYSYWTGYLTSRPNLKGLVRETGNYLTSSSHLIMDYLLGSHVCESVLVDAVNSQFFLRENHAICQHHDAVAGTAKEHVSEDYELRLNSSIDKTKNVMGNILKEINSDLKDIKICIADPVSNRDCHKDYNLSVSENSILLGIYNPGLEGNYPVTIHLKNIKNVEIKYEDSFLPSDLFCIEDSDFKDELNCQLKFIMSFKKEKAFITLKMNLSASKSENKVSPLFSEKNHKIIENDALTVSFDSENLKFITKVLRNGNIQNYEYKISHGFYNSFDGYNSKMKPNNSNPDGAYILSTVEEYPLYFDPIKEKSQIIKGKLSTMVLIRYQQSYLLINVINDPYMIEVESIWDPIKDKSQGKNFLLLVDSDLENLVSLPDGQSQPEFWTDSNGMKLMRRFKDFRQKWKYEITDKVSGNFYPINSKFSIRDRLNYTYSEKDYDGLSEDDRVLTVLNDRPQSAGAMQKGQIMFLVHRFSVKDDWRGVGEPIWEVSSATKYFHTRHIVSFSNSSQNYYENLLQNKPIISKINSEVQFDSSLYKLITHSENIIVNFHVKKPKQIFVQFYNMQDPYYLGMSQEYFSFNKVNGVTYTIEEYKFNSVSPLEKFCLKFLEEDSTFNLDSQDLKLFLLKFS
jgi:lysosomal alpha-mannosidase